MIASNDPNNDFEDLNKSINILAIIWTIIFLGAMGLLTYLIPYP